MAKIEGYGISLNMGDIDLMNIERVNPDPEVIAANKALEGQTFTCRVDKDTVIVKENKG